MRVAALYEVHANLPALEAVLAEVDRASVDAIVVGGDAVAGPFPAETFELLVSLPGALFVRGNADRLVVERSEGFGSQWCADQLGEERQAAVRALAVQPAAGCRRARRGDVLPCDATHR